MTTNLSFCSLALLAFTITAASCTSGHLTEANVLDSASIGEPLPAATITSSKSCFTGPFKSYDTWLKRLRESNKNFNAATFESRIPRERYDRAESQLDCQLFLYTVGEVTVVGYSVRPISHQYALPVIIYNRGGNASHAKINFRTLFNRIIPLAEQGFFVIASQYRGSGLEREGIDPGVDEFGGKDVDDVMAIFDLIDKSPYTDKSRIGMFGWSRGAIMSFLAATRTDRLSALVVGGAPSDILEEVKTRPVMERVFEARIPNYNNNRESALKSRSVLYWAEKLPKSLPILILHGQADKNVTINSALNFAVELQKQEIPYRLVVYENGSHALLEVNQQVNSEVAQWFADKLSK